MDWKVTLNEEAYEDILKIKNYISFFLLAPETAKKQVDRIFEEIAKLDTLPYRFSLYKSEKWKEKGLRYFPVDNYLIFYYVEDKNGQVVVLRVMYKGRNVKNILG